VNDSVISKTIDVSVKEFNNRYNNYYPNVTTYDYTEKIDISTESGINRLTELVMTNVHSFYRYTDNVRSEDTFISASAIILDFDNKGDHSDSTITEFINSQFADKYNWFLYTSKSHIPDEVDCFHVAMILKEPVTSIKDLRRTYSYIFSELKNENIYCDYQVRDAARLIFPSRESGTLNYDRFEVYNNNSVDYFSIKNIPSTYVDLFVSPPKTKKTTKKKYKAVYPSSLEKSKYHIAFDTMSDNEKYIYASKIVVFLNNINKKHNFTKISRLDWISLGFSLNTVFGYDDGLLLFNTLSVDHPNDTNETIMYQYNSIDTRNNYTLGIDTLIKISAKLGFDHKLYFIYFYKTKHDIGVRAKHDIYREIVTILCDDVYGYSYKIYGYDNSTSARTFLLETIKPNGVFYRKVTLTEIIDVASMVMGVHRDFITTSVTSGIIRKFIRFNGVFDYKSYIINEFTTSKHIDGNLYKISHIPSIIASMKKFIPKRIMSKLTVSYIIDVLVDAGIVVDKIRKRIDGIQYTCLLIDEDALAEHKPDENVGNIPIDTIMYNNMMVLNDGVVDFSIHIYLYRMRTIYLRKKMLNLCNDGGSDAY